MTTIRHEATVPLSAAGWRFDRALAEMFPEYSRSRLTAWVKAGAVTVTQSSGFPRLDAAVECVVRRLPFEPGKRDGQPVDSQVSVPIVFKLEE